MSDDFDAHEVLTAETAAPYVIKNLGIESHETRTALRRLVNQTTSYKRPLAEVMWAATQAMDEAVAAARDAVFVAREIALETKQPIQIDPTLILSLQTPEQYIAQAIEERKTGDGEYNQGMAYKRIDATSKDTNSLTDSKLINASVDTLIKLDATATKFKKLALKFAAYDTNETGIEDNGTADIRVRNAVSRLRGVVSPETADALKQLEFQEFAAVLWAAKVTKESTEKRNTPTRKPTRSSLDDLLDEIDQVIGKDPVASEKPVAGINSEAEHFITGALHLDIEDRAAQIHDLDLAKRVKALGGGIKTDEDAVDKAIESLALTKSHGRLAG